MGEIKFIAVPEKLLTDIDSILALFWDRGGMGREFKLREAEEFNKKAGALRDIIKGKSNEA